jgi:putative ABC transport system substrate-binding protein
MLIASVTSQAGQAAKVKRIGLLQPDSSPFPCDWKQRSPFAHRLRELGWVEGQNLVVEERWAEGRLERLPELAAELVRLKADVLVAGPPPAVHVLKRATSTTPIVMLAGDPVAEGLVENLARPGGNITGLTLYGLELIGKRLELFKQAVPGLSRLAVLASAAMLDRMATAPYQVYWQELEAAAQSLGAQLHIVPVRDASELEGAFRAMTGERVDALFVWSDRMFSTHRHRIAPLAIENRLPTAFGEKEYVWAGGLISYQVGFGELLRRAADYVDRILKGARPADLPVEQPTQFELVINLKTAKALGLTIPPSLLLLADEVIRVTPTPIIPTPSDVNITPPAAHLPPEVAAFSGTWEGAWDGLVPSRLVVESINAASACVVFAWADPPDTLFRGEWVRGKGKMLPGGRLEMVAGPGLIFTFTMAKDHMSILGERAETRHMGAQLALVTMKKVGP